MHYSTSPANLIWLGLALLCAPALGKGGGWSSSGGAGIACFATQGASDEAFRLTQQNLPLTDALRAQVTTVEALDLWEQLDWLTFKRNKGWTRERVLADLHKFLGQRSPLFESRMKLVERRIPLDQWNNDRELLPIPDSNVRRADVLAAHPLCRKVQLARRTERSREGLLPEAFISVDQALFDKMDALNQTAIFVHEVFYLFGMDFGPKDRLHEDSDEIRKLVAMFLSDNFRRDISQAPQISDQAHLVQEFLIRLFGDYFLYFDQEGDLTVKIPPGTTNQITRHQSFGSILKKLRAQIHLCPGAGAPTFTAERKACMDAVMDPRKNQKLMTDEEAFVFLTRWILDQAPPSPPTVQSTFSFGMKAPRGPRMPINARNFAKRVEPFVNQTTCT